MQNAIDFLLSHFVLITLHLFSLLIDSNSNQNKQILTVQIFVVLDRPSVLQNTLGFNFRSPRRPKELSNCQLTRVIAIEPIVYCQIIYEKCQIEILKFQNVIKSFRL